MDPDFWKGRSVLITGHTGFKGAWLTILLARLGANVTGLSLAPETKPNLFEMACVEGLCRSIIGDIRDATTVTDAMRDAQPVVVLHLAAQALVRRSYRDPVGTYASNVMGTVHVLEAIRNTPSVAAAVVVTSDKCYENKNWVWAYREDEPMGGHDPYSNSKGCCELITAAYRSSFMDPNKDGQSSVCRLASGRAGNVIGGGDWSEDRLVPDMVRAFALGESVEIRAPGSTRPWQHVLEPLHGYLRLAEALCSLEGSSFSEGWNFGPADSDCERVSFVVEAMSRAWGHGATWHLSGGQHAYEAHLLKVDASKARSRLGWTPRLNLDQTLSWTVEWYKHALADPTSALGLCQRQIDRYLSPKI